MNPYHIASCPIRMRGVEDAYAILETAALAAAYGQQDQVDSLRSLTQETLAGAAQTLGVRVAD